MNNRINTTLDSLRERKRKALSLFITAGYPTIDATPEIVQALAASGADMIELGIPFSDPLADGPTIQASSDIAIANGVTMATVFTIVERIRERTNIPVILMGYVNPILAFGIERFMETASAKGADGVIVPDIPVEESDAYRRAALQYELAPIFLAAPTSSDHRLERIDAASEGFVYCVSVTGVTGQRNGLPQDVREYLQRCRKHIVKNPMLVGFGISSGNDAGALAPYADGIIVGSALIKKIDGNRNGDFLTVISEFAGELRHGLDVSFNSWEGS
jgi:tryptophan synthase alpha chain